VDSPTSSSCIASHASFAGAIGIPVPSKAAKLFRAVTTASGRSPRSPGVPERWRAPDPSLRPPVVIPIQLRKGDFEVSFFTAITTLGTPLDVTLQELRIESFFPADEESDRRIRELADR
jgi:hypothetical protein